MHRQPGDVKIKLTMAVPLLALAGGCLRIDPKPDYQKVQQLVSRSTGSSEAYQPDDEDAIARRVKEFLDRGLTVDVAVQISLLNNPEFQAAWMAVGMARA